MDADATVKVRANNDARSRCCGVLAVWPDHYPHLPEDAPSHTCRSSFPPDGGPRGGQNLLNPSGGGSVEPEDDDTPDKTTVEELVNSPDGALRTIAEELLRLHKEKREAQVAIPLILEIRLVIPHIDNPHSCGG
eukprot:TRINITY_DN548_c0_g5_i2.p1 TRINITY_DN548_c0_g5~~TRINITY_DN548_c0_g5_i2.p1  ORF type:complete len:134 (+),score=24.29 TRINITY_DN548_c0_g5_i2:365-766(+)